MTNIVKSEGTALAIRPPVEIIERLVASNDLKQLTPTQRLQYYDWRCRSIGIDPAAQPFEYLELDGKLVLYPKAQLADQLRQLHNLSVKLGESAIEHGVYTRVAVASTPDGRVAENIGAVSVREPDRIKVWENRQSRWEENPKAGQQITGVALANAIKKAATQAQRRATFSLMGLGGQDADDVEEARRLDVAAVHDPKGLLPTDNAKPTQEPAEASDDGQPVEWSDGDKWPVSGVETTTGKILNAERRKATGGAEFVRATVEDIAGETAMCTFSESGMAAIERLVDKLAEITFANTGKGYRILAVKESAQ